MCEKRRYFFLTTYNVSATPSRLCVHRALDSAEVVALLYSFFIYLQSLCGKGVAQLENLMQ